MLTTMILATTLALASPPLAIQGCEWKQNASEPHRYYLFRNGVQVGGWDTRTSIWRDYDAAHDVWSAPKDPPWNYGVDTSRISKTEAYHVDGKAVSKQQAQQAIGADLPDDARRTRLTVIGSDADRQRVLADLAGAPALGALRSTLLVQDYAPTDWAVAKAGFVTTGQPTIYLQAPDGKVLHRQDDYDGPTALVEAIRKANPDYKPQKDPDLRKPLAIPGLPNVPPVVWLIGIVTAYLLLRKD